MWKYGQNQMNQGASGGGGPNMMPMGGFMQGGAGMHMSPQQQQQHQMNQMMGSGGPGGPGGMQMNPNAGGGNGPAGLMQGMGMSPQHQMQQQHQMMQGGVGVPMSNMPQQQSNVMQQQMMGPQQGVGMGGGGGVGPQQQQPNIPQQQQQQHNPGTGAAGGGGGNNMLAISQPNPHKEINIVQLSRLGQETVQDIASRFQEVFSALKNIQPTSHRDNNTEKKVQEYFRTIRLLFKRVRIIYEKCNDAGMDYMNAETLIPYKDEPDPRIEPSQCDEYRKVLQENQELIETVKLKNRQLREIIDRTRIIIWEINTMLAMRRS
ncbi:PREDICTED: mediator of RNA polymerase II transcription subunit 30 [Drosophila arizonae]|uniref:Mediator of RNA polymerase II transcription subunit 30 n=1 Tax=Drosophila arizonae TaxID=7263 RepID=A0ABM1P475_DROAR|nr:PREDICTED: mediator of RNA polymerase II transcription subunit 30 [Drosophila arizonae]